MPLDVGRVQKELKEIEKDQASGVRVVLRGSDLQLLTGWVPGPRDTPYDGGQYEIAIELPEQYPFVPPKMRFVTKVWHPNISSQNGAICLDILKDQWSPALTIKTAMLSLQALLSSPQPDDPQDAVVAKQYLSDREVFNKTARHWTEAFAIPKNEDANQLVAKLCGMGFERAQVEQALKVRDDDFLHGKELHPEGARTA